MRMRFELMRVVVAVAVVLCAGGALRAQDVAGRESKPTAMAADADPDWEVATVKPSDPNETGVHRVVGAGEMAPVRQLRVDPQLGTVLHGMRRDAELLQPRSQLVFVEA